MKFLGLLSFYSYVAALLALGLFGVFFPEFELKTLYQVDLETMGLDRPSLIVTLHQYRFLKVIVVGFGIWAVVFRKEIFASATFNYVFLGILFSAALGRTLSMILDGKPHWLLINFTISEFAFGLLIFAYSRTALEKT